MEIEEEFIAGFCRTMRNRMLRIYSAGRWKQGAYFYGLCP